MKEEGKSGTSTVREAIQTLRNHLGRVKDKRLSLFSANLLPPQPLLRLIRLLKQSCGHTVTLPLKCS